MITVNTELCAKDAICVEECPTQIISMEEEVPIVVDNLEQYCINCGHCVVVCPKGALTLKTLAPDQCLPVNKSLHLSTKHVEHFLRSRRSIRSYKDKTVEYEWVTKLLDLASYAPTASNKQPVKWQVVYERADVVVVVNMVIDWMKDFLQKMPLVATEMGLEHFISSYKAGYDRVCRGAPHLVFAYADKMNTDAATDCIIALSYLELALLSFGLGGCWGGWVNHAVRNWPPLKKFLRLDEAFDYHGVLMFGYPKYRYHRMPLRTNASIDLFKS